MTARAVRRLFAWTAVAAAAVTLGACSSASASPAGAANRNPATRVVLALDYITNNASFEGFYVAQAKGYYADAGLNVTIVGYTSTTADVLVNAGRADFGTIDEPSLILDRAAGEPLTAVMAIMQHDPLRIAVAPKDSTSVTSPKDLAGKTFGSFGEPIEKVYNDAVFARLGLKPSYNTITLGTDVYNALLSGRVDWALAYDTDDILWAKMRGTPLTTFDPRDYGVPDSYGKLLFSSVSYLKAHPATARMFVAATVRGYEWAQQHPAAALAVLVRADVGPLIVSEQTATSKMLAGQYWLAPDGKVGQETAGRWTAYTRFLFKSGVLVDSAGKPLTTEPDPSTWFTNDFLPR